MKIKTVAVVLLLLSISSASFAVSRGTQSPETPKVQVDQKTLESYVGRYAFKGDVFFDVTLESGALHVKAPGQEKVTLSPTSTSSFNVVETPGIGFTFEKDAQGQIDGMTVHQSGDHKAKKVSSVVPETPYSKFDPNKLENYAGQYEVTAGFIVTVTAENGKINAQPQGDEKISFQHDSGTDFSSDDIKLHFAINDEGNVSGMSITMAGSIRKAKKVK